MLQLSIASTADWPAIEAFLLTRMTSSLFLIGNGRAAGVVHTGARYSGDYVFATEHGAVVGVAAHYWNGNVMLQTPPAHVPALLDTLLRHSGRALRGLIGPVDQVNAARAAQQIQPAQTQLDEPEVLFALDLAALRVPAALRDGALTARRTRESDIDVLATWQAEFMIESLNAVDGPETRANARAAATSALNEQRAWITFDGDTPVAQSVFSTHIAECVQIGGVYTPPALRGRGYARCVVAQSLLDAHADGVRQAVLFTPHTNHAAQRAYRALGFEAIGEYGLLLLKEDSGPQTADGR